MDFELYRGDVSVYIVKNPEPNVGTVASYIDNNFKVIADYIGTGAATTYLSLSGGTMSGNIAMGGHNISGGGTITATTFVGALTGNASTATSATSATNATNAVNLSGSITESQVTGLVSDLGTKLALAGGTMSGNLNLNSHSLTNVGSLLVSGVTVLDSTGTVQLSGRTAGGTGGILEWNDYVNGPSTSGSAAPNTYYGGSISSGTAYLSDPSNWLMIVYAGTPYAIPVYGPVSSH